MDGIRVVAGCWRLGLAMGLLVPLAAAAQPPGNARQGHDLARRWCTGCHVVDAQQKTANASGAPPFAAIAAMPSATPRSLHAFLTAPHSSMPDLQLSEHQVDDLTAYIESLKGR